MKIILPAIILFTLVLPVVVLAQAAPSQCTLVRDLTDINAACTKGATVNIDTFGLCCAINAIHRIVDIIFFALLAVAVVFFILGAFTIITSAGAPERVASGRNYILYAILGLVIAFLARAVPAIAKFVLGA